MTQIVQAIVTAVTMACSQQAPNNVNECVLLVLTNIQTNLTKEIDTRRGGLNRTEKLQK